VPCATIDYAKGAIPEDHRLSLGILGAGGHSSAIEYFKESDLILSFGVRMNHQNTAYFRSDLYPNTVQIDSDPREIGRSLPIGLGVLGNVPATLRAVRQAAEGSSRNVKRDTVARVADLRSRLQTYAKQPIDEAKANILPDHLFQVLREELPRETLVVSDTGWTAIGFKRAFPVYSEEGFFALYALASMGSGMPMALGVQTARPDAPVVSVIGDGGMLVHTSELNVAAQWQLPVLHVVVKNGLYKSVGERQKYFFGKYYNVEIENPSFSKIAEGFGCRGYSANCAREVRSAVKSWLADRRPAVLEVDVGYDSMMEGLPHVTNFTQALFGKPRRADWPFPPLGAPKP